MLFLTKFVTVLFPSLSIHVANAGKKFGKEWVFKQVNFTISQSQKIVILGLNGSGKSTLLQALACYLPLNEGHISYSKGHQLIDEDKQYRFMSLASPYLELIEDYTLYEHVQHIATYKPFLPSLSLEEIIRISGLSSHRNKYIKLFSSGMKQRLKLTMAILANCPILLLDEPTSNLDATVITWYQDLIRDHAMDKTIVVCSNSIRQEYEFCDTIIEMEHLKHKTSLI